MPAHPTKTSTFPWLAALPLAVVLLTAVAAALATMVGRPQSESTRYHQLAAQSLERRDFPAAKLCYERLLRLDPTNPATTFGLAQSLDGLARHDQAAMLLERLAPLTPSLGSANYAPAHLWQAERLLNAVPLTPANISTAKAHVRAALQSDPHDPHALALRSALDQLSDPTIDLRR